MANCHDLFQEFNSRLRLTDGKRENLQSARDVLRVRIKNHFSESNPSYVPEFQGQGSYVMDTIINPIKGNYDLDDGVYFIGNLTADKRPTPETFHRWVMDAIGDHTNSVIDKNTCIRVVYANGFHIDLPLYYASYYHPELAHKKKGWILSNPIEFIAWFEEKIGSGFQQEYLFEATKQEEFRKWAEDVRKLDAQLRKIVRYMKGWGDYKNNGMPSGIILTILSAENYHPDFRDDVAMLQTLINIYNSLQKEFVCRRPTTPKGEDLFAEYDAASKRRFMESLEKFILSGESALGEGNKKLACTKWQEHFGDRFPCHLVIDEASEKKNVYEPLKAVASQNKPWCSI